MATRAFGRRPRPTAASSRPKSAARPAGQPLPAAPEQPDVRRQRAKTSAAISDVVTKIHPTIVKSLDMTKIAELDNERLAAQLLAFLETGEAGLPDLSPLDRQQVVTQLVHDIKGLGPIEPLLLDRQVSDILINGMDSVYIERRGRLEHVDVRFRDQQHLLHIAQRIAGWVGRRVDESSPMVDARLPDGSRVNIVIPPLAIDGAAISIRRFTMRGISLEDMAERQAMSEAMAELFRVSVRARLNILVSGGTGSGKTTFMNALSQKIDHGERLVTIEDAAELQLQQPHVVRLETRTMSAEGTGQVTMRDLLVNTLRMRPDRIIVGEVRGGDLAPLRALIVSEPELRSVRVRRIARGIALSGEVGSAAAADRALRLATASLPEDMLVESNLRILPNVEELRVLLAGDPILQAVRVKRLARGVALNGNVASQGAADQAMRLAAASLPEGMLVENNLEVGLDLGPLRSLMAGEPGLNGVQVQRVARGVALSGEIASVAAADRVIRLAVASLPEDLLVENNLRIETDLQPLRALLAKEPDLHRVRVQRVARGVALSGEVGSAAASERALRFAAASLPEDALVDNHMRITGPQQVNLEVQIAEVQRSVAEDFGFNWEIFGHSNDPLGFGFRIGRGLPDGTSLAGPERLTGRPHPGLPPNVGTNDDGSILLSIPTTAVDGLLSPTFMLQRAWDNVGLNAFVDALAKAGLANVLARPNVTANSGETASFFSGGEYPLPTGFDDGVIVFEYKKYGVLLDFVPTIIDEDRIELTVRPEVSEPSQDNSVQVVAGVNVPVINVRRAQTTVEMGDGESIVIAGLFRSASNDVESGVPLLKDLPLVGAIFGHSSLRSDELELIVTVTARLVDAVPPPAEAGLAASGKINKYYY